MTREKILETFSSAHIHPDGFNIIMQGDVTSVIELSPEGRREIIDQVAGISLYDEKGPYITGLKFQVVIIFLACM